MNSSRWRFLVYRWAEHPARNALILFGLATLIALLYVWRAVAAYGPAYIRDPYILLSYIAFPTLFGLLAFAVLRFAAQERQSRDLAHAIMENAPIGVFMTDTRGTIIFANKMHLHLMGEQGLDQAIGLNLLELPTVKGKMLESAFRRALAGERFEIHDLPYTSIYGKSTFLSGFIVPLKDPAEHVSGLLVLMEDVTLQHQLQEETHRARETLQRTIDSIADVVYVIDRTGYFRFVNQQLEKIGQYKREELVGKHFSQFIAPESRAVFESALQKVIETGQPAYREILARLSDSVLIEVGVALAPIQDRDEIVITQREIMTTKRLSRELAQRTEQAERRAHEFQTLYEISLALGEKRAFDELTQVVYERVRTLLPTDVFFIARYVAEQNLVRFEKWIEDDKQLTPFAESLDRLDGLCPWIIRQCQPILSGDTHNDPHLPAGSVSMGTLPRSWLGVPLVAHNRVVGVLSVQSHQPEQYDDQNLRLLTAIGRLVAVAVENAALFEQTRAHSEEMAAAYAELKELDRLKTEFVQNVSHELRTPLTFIKGYAEILLSQSLGPLSAQQEESLQTVKEKTDALIHLVNDILFLQQLDAGYLDLQTVSLGEVASRAVRGAMAAAEAAGITIRTEIPLWLPSVRGDPDRLMQVWDNLLSNAIKFSPIGGEIRVRIAEHGDQVLAQIRDHGIGIPPEHIDRIFDRFFQVDGSTTRAYQGAGLGLAIVKKIVEAHGGRIWAESVSQRGSTFYFTIPKGSGQSANS